MSVQVGSLRSLLSFFLVLSCVLAASRLYAQTRAEELLTRDLARSTKNVEAEFRLYNYFNVTQTYQELLTPEGRQSFLNRYFQSSLQRFWDMSNHQSTYVNAGPGLYAAIDPYISKEFGNTLVEFSVPVGTRYLDVVHPAPLESDTITALLNEGVISTDTYRNVLLKVGTRYALTRDTLKNVVQPGYESLRAMLQKIFRDQNITMIEYNWNTSLEGFCRQHSYSAFVIIGHQIENQNQIEENFSKFLIYGADLPNLTSQENDRVQSVRHFVELLASLKTAPSSSARRDLVGQFYPDENIKDEIINETYSCKE